MEINLQLFGEDSVEVSNNYYLKAQIQIKKGQIPEAKESLLESIRTFSDFENGPKFVK